MWDQPDKIVRGGGERVPVEPWMKALIKDNPASVNRNITGGVGSEFCCIIDEDHPYTYAFADAPPKVGGSGAARHASGQIVGVVLHPDDRAAGDPQTGDAWYLKHVPLCLFIALDKHSMTSQVHVDGLPPGVVPIEPRDQTWAFDVIKSCKPFHDLYKRAGVIVPNLWKLERHGFVLRPSGGASDWARQGRTGPGLIDAESADGRGLYVMLTRANNMNDWKLISPLRLSAIQQKPTRELEDEVVRLRRVETGTLQRDRPFIQGLIDQLVCLERSMVQIRNYQGVQEADAAMTEAAGAAESSRICCANCGRVIREEAEGDDVCDGCRVLQDSRNTWLNVVSKRIPETRVQLEALLTPKPRAGRCSECGGIYPLVTSTMGGRPLCGHCKMLEDKGLQFRPCPRCDLLFQPYKKSFSRRLRQPAPCCKGCVGKKKSRGGLGERGGTSKNKRRR
jgi:hypothetical protein